MEETGTIFVVLLLVVLSRSPGTPENAQASRDTDGEDEDLDRAGEVASSSTSDFPTQMALPYLLP